MEIEKACCSFPAEFGLRGFPEKTFRVSEGSSYWEGDPSGSLDGYVVIYTQILCEDGVWKDFVKIPQSELRAQMVRL